MAAGSALAKSNEVVQRALSEKSLGYEVVVLDADTRTAAAAADTLNCGVEQIVKSLIFRTSEDSEAVLVLASGINRVNEKSIKSHLGKKITKADADFVREVTGFAIGGIPPLGHKQAIKHIFIDEDLLQYDDLWAAAGSPNSVFKLNSKDLKKMTDGRIVSVA